ncbi:YdeI/OmpD-associated family protein [Chitinophaga japonensis]|uniref:Bacteriocin resistance YdeI/OmpD-like protein n=1 Tax=Chitinophaga japonensis TaxID=104662 RepID=A0A562SZC4_CHIJA|nr:YdeI/OmpD-associated family protein [Chitinophaga japonensis]TWI86655.1 bacteriocin resistance YdeI/OmpD-like protein [Chitinophaga japonensis]
MVKFTTTIHKFDSQGEKTGWTYIEIPADLAQELKPGNKQSFRVKGKLDKHPIQAVALMPMGGGSFIMPLNATMRKAIGKRQGAMLQVQLAVDDNPEPVSCPELMECLADDPDALSFFNSLTKGHRNYFMQWINSAKTQPTREKRITQAVVALGRKQGFPEMVRAQKGSRM